MNNEHYQRIVYALQTDTVPAGASSASNWRRFARKFELRPSASGEPVLYRVFEEEDEEGNEVKTAKIVLKESDLVRTWDECHNQFHAGRNKT